MNYTVTGLRNHLKFLTPETIYYSHTIQNKSKCVNIFILEFSMSFSICFSVGESLIPNEEGKGNQAMHRVHSRCLTKYLLIDSFNR